MLAPLAHHLRASRVPLDRHLTHRATFDLDAADHKDRVASRAAEHAGQRCGSSGSLDQSLSVFFASFTRMPRGRTQRTKLFLAARTFDIDWKAI